MSSWRALVLALLGAYAAIPTLAVEPLCLHPDNPHYFLFRGKPTVLVGSGEHYGAVINRDFDYRLYLQELENRHLNHARIWAGAYREVSGNFSIAQNTLAPAWDRFVCPWPRSSTPGSLDGGNKFDLTRWDREYFSRLKNFIGEAGRHGIHVELNLFCPYYEDSMWNVSPLNSQNNINGVGGVPRTEVFTLKHPKLVAIEKAMVRKVVSELAGFENLYYEICNEPYFGGVSMEWQGHMAKFIAQMESQLSTRHLISQNIANGSTRVTAPLNEVSIFNFHYSRPPDSVGMNYDLGRAIGNNETGFDGSADSTYRIQGWDFLMAGGAIYSHLDYSFTAGHERGDFQYPPETPGGGSAALRSQLGFLQDFFDSIPFIRMSPATNVIKGGIPKGASARGLAQPGKAYAVYIHHSRSVKDAKPRIQVDSKEQRLALALDLPPGSYEASWFDPKTGGAVKNARFVHDGGIKTLYSPSYREDIALRILGAIPAGH